MKALQGFTVWAIVVFSCLFEISHAHCNGTCSSTVIVTTTTTTISAQNCNISIDGINQSSEITGLQPGGVYSVYANCSGDCCLKTAVTRPAAVTIKEISGSTTGLTVSWSRAVGGVDNYTVILYNDTDKDRQDVLSNGNFSTSFTGLKPGVQYCAVVITKSGPLENNSSKSCNATFPNPPGNITVSQTNRSIRFDWGVPEDMQPDKYNFKVTTFLGTHHTKNNYSELNDLQPGSPYRIAVATVGVYNYTSREVVKEAFTSPAAVTNLNVSVSTNYLNVTWSAAEGRVDNYTVILYNKSTNQQAVNDLSNDTQSTSFNGLKPGVLYCAEVVTKSGPWEMNSSKLCSTTFPNPPGSINVTFKTEQSLTFAWGAPKDMQRDQYIFNVTFNNKSTETQNNSITFNDLQSGSPYNIIVVTVGAEKLVSQEVRKMAYTKPYAVTELQQTEITTDSVTLKWNQSEYKANYTYLVAVSNISGSQILLNNVTNFTFTVNDLMSGTNYSFTVTTQTPDGTKATPKTVHYFTRPYGIEALAAETLNTTSVKLTWDRPKQYKHKYTYLVTTSGCREDNNSTVDLESIEIAGLIPGTKCHFCVIVKAENEIEGKSNCTSQYTKPEKAEPYLFSQGSNSSMQVSWTKPNGSVEFYTVYLNGSDVNSESEKLNSSSRHHVLNNLSAGRKYTVFVVTQSGPFNASSEPVTNATFPNPPGDISILNKTTGSIHIRWGDAPLMSGAQFHYRLEIPSQQVNITNETNYLFKQLQSGTPYNVSVTTVAAMDFESETKWTKSTTRPFSVKSLQATARERSVTMNWGTPDQYKDSYRFSVALLNSTGNTVLNVITKKDMHTFSSLDSGTSYSLTVTTETSDGTQGAQEKTQICTDASAVESIYCNTTNGPNATITLFWEKPRSGFSTFSVQFDKTTTQENCRSTVEGLCKFERGDLIHYKNYIVNVTTESCGKPSSPKTKTCQTGITAPPLPNDYKSMISLDDVKFNEFTININSNLLDNTYGPIKHVGVLVTENANDFSHSAVAKYLEKNYKQWKDKETDVYLASVINVDTNGNGKTRSTTKSLTIHVGDETIWNSYPNGHLEATKQYKFAIVLFTDLQIKNNIINGQASYFSNTQLDNSVKLPQNPVVIGLAVGLTLAIFCILFIVLIGFIIYWRRLSNKESSDIQIHSLRAKVSFPVSVEDYEMYYKKQKADSNCGFAEEYEDLKVVGTGQSKTNALNTENKPKNRYNNVLPYDVSRVKLSIIHGTPIDDYINANYIPGYNSRKEFIAAQGPLPATVNDFWRMIWEKNVHTIVMLTRCNEQGRVKCEQYWTPGSKLYGNITVTTASEIPLDDWTIRDFDIKNVKTAETRSVRHFHFTAWPDHGVPETTELLISFRHLVREHMEQYGNSPTVVHCSAGVGRTGTFIAIDRLIFQIERENVVDVYGIVYDMRMHRSLMVQTEDQYVFLNQCALDIIRSRTGNNVDLIYQNTIALSIYENIELQKK